MIKSNSNNNDGITFTLPESVLFNILDILTLELSRFKYSHLTLDFSKVNYIDSEGALSIICFCSALKSSKNLTNNRNIIIDLILPSANVLLYLTSLGFFGQMSNKVGIIGKQELIQYENNIRQNRKLKQKYYSNDNTLKPFIFPIETIPQQINTTSGRDFENMTRLFVNNAIDTLEALFYSSHFNFDGEDQHDFLLSNLELYKNIFEHSKSWGIASIHARPNYGTTVCYYDIGIGFKESVAKFDSELKSIQWALVDGNSTKPGDDNDGFGLTIVQNFVFNRKGYIRIRSGECLLQKNSTSEQLSKVPSIPGVQFSYFIPIKQNL